MSNPELRAQCCGKRPDLTRGVTLQEIPDLLPLVKERPGGDSQRRCFDCSACGQVWEERWIPFMHSDLSVVLKEEARSQLDEPPREWVKPPPEEPWRRDRRLGHWILIPCCVLGMILGLATRPGPEAGASARGNHFALCLLGGAAVGVVLNILRESRRR